MRSLEYLARFKRRGQSYIYMPIISVQRYPIQSVAPAMYLRSELSFRVTVVVRTPDNVACARARS